MKHDKQEYHVFARFSGQAVPVLVGVTLSERTARKIYLIVEPVADEMYYNIKPRRSESKPWRGGKARSSTRYV